MEIDNETEKHEFNPTTLEIAQKIVAAIKFLKKVLSVFSLENIFLCIAVFRDSARLILLIRFMPV